MSLTDFDVRFEPGDPARAGRVVLESTRGESHRYTVDEAIPRLLEAYRDEHAVASARWWGAATALALDLIGRGRIVPRLATGDVDEWRVGPLDIDDRARMDELVRAAPVRADTLALLRAYLDACADVLPRRSDATAAYVAREVVSHPELREWVDDLAGGLRVVLRIERDSDSTANAGNLSLVVAFYLPDEPALIVDAERLWAGAHDFGTRGQVDAVLAIRRAARVWSPIGRLLDLAVPDRLQLSDDETAELVGMAGERLRSAGVIVRWPRSLVTDVQVHAHIGGDRPTGTTTFGGTDLFDFRWQIAIGDLELSKAELDRIAESTRPVVRLHDQWVVVSDDVVARARERTRKPLTRVEAISASLSGRIATGRDDAEVTSAPALAELRDRLAAGEAGEEPLVQPAALQATLRDYQLRGVRWLDRMTSLGLGCCLADDMGLGKTITVIALHLARAEREVDGGPTLVVCPASLIGNWEREIERFAPGSAVRRFHGSGRSVDDVRDGFVLTTYGTMRRDAERLGSIGWGLVVADEAQHVKNRQSSTARELRRIDASARVALTGTPIENNLGELWAILDWAIPGLLGSSSEFARRYADPIESERDTVVAERLRRLVAPFMLRRHKTDPGIAPELPRKTETDQFVSLTEEQVGLYEAAVREGMSEVSAGDDAGIDRKGKIFAMLTALKQICNHPAQYLREDNPRLPGRSGKLELLDELLDVILSEHGAALVFTQYVAMARLLRRHLAARGVDAYLLDGSTPVAQRQELVDGFQRGDVSVFLLSLKAAGTGLNLTRADHVVHYDRWWNPAVETQATDRAYRIGQTRPVQVHRMVAEGTIEDRIAAMLSSKRELAAAVLESGEGALSKLSDRELEELVSLRRPA